MDPEAQNLSAPTSASSSSTLPPTIDTGSKILPSAMKPQTDGMEKLQKQGSESPRGSLRFLLPSPVVSIREVGDEVDENGRRGSCEEDGCSYEDDEDEGEDEASHRSLLGARRGLERGKRRGVGRRGRRCSVSGRGRAERWWMGWRGTLALWVVLIALGSAMGFIFVENAEEEIPMPEDPGQNRSDVKESTALVEKGVGDAGSLGELELELLKREVPNDAKWLYDAQDLPNDLVPDNTTDRDKLIQSRNGAVSSDVEVCSDIGVALMKKGGNAVDAAIGTAACIGTVNMFASGIGGGGFAVVRTASGGSRSFNFREMAPKAAHRDMYHGDPLLAQRGGLAFAIPGEVDGFWRLHQKYGSLPWKELWKPSISLNRKGFRVTETLAMRIASEKAYFEAHRDEWEFLFSKESGELLVEGEVMRRPQLAKTLTTIAGKGGLEVFYKGWIAESLARAAREAGGIITKEDFGVFFTVEGKTVRTRAFGREFVTCDNPCSGPVLIEALNIAEGLNVIDPSEAVTIHRMVETMKWMSAGRTELGDPTDTEVFNGPRISELMTHSFAESVRQNISDSRTYPWKHYNPSYELTEPKGTSHISVLDPFGNAVALTTTVNLYWGALVHDTNTGIVLNSEMDDFSIPGKSNAHDLEPSIYNYIKPYKRPLSSTAPTISAERDGKPGIVIGASGGSRIVTSVFECIVKSYLWGYDLLDVVKSPRVHHQLIPEIAYVERGVSEKVIEGLRERGHKVEVTETVGSVVGAVRRGEDGTISAVADWWRKGGKAAGF